MTSSLGTWSHVTCGELAQVPSGRIKDILKLDMQNLIYRAKYTNLQIEIGSGSNQSPAERTGMAWN